MSPSRLVQFIITALLVVTQVSFAALRTVSKNSDDGGQYRTITDAIKDADVGDEIIIQDYETYEEQVTINKNGITLTSANPTNKKKPIIKYTDKTNVGPKTAAEAKIEEKITFDQNGAVRVMRAVGVTIDGIIVDGGGSAPFAYPGIWNAKDPLFHGNAAITLWVAGDATIRNCELRNAYFGINIKDRNEGGIYANSNPADLETWRVVPLSGFGKTGNHLIENNKIHNNDWGLFFESSWDLGSTVRYNLIYENHHAAKDVAKIAAMDDGGNQPGGAILFKDDLLSPVAIYNNTFFHNFLMIVGHWQAGYQHLVFNNIMGKPYEYWEAAKGSIFMDFTFMEMHLAKNNLFACQQMAPQTQTQNYQWGMTDPTTGKYVEKVQKFTGVSQVRITNEIGQGTSGIEVAGEDVPVTITLDDGTDTTKYMNANFVIQPGALISKTFPKTSNNRWLETKFKSIDPDDDFFLVPDWDDPLMKQFIVDQGWKDAGITDEDGSLADIGAIPFTSMSDAGILIKPTQPIIIKGTTATASFDLKIPEGVTMNNPKIKYTKWIDGLTYQADIFGSNGDSLTLKSNIKDITPSKTTVGSGSNVITFSVPARNSNNGYAFLQIVVEGTDKDGNTITSNVGFLPYRSLQYQFQVRIKDKEGTKLLTSVRAGDTVQMVVVPVDSSGKIIQVAIDTAEAALNSANILFNQNIEPFTFARNFTVKDSVNYVVFTKVPDDNSKEYVSVSGKFMANTKDTIGVAIRGTSEAIQILPGPADHVKFYDPASGGVKQVNPGSTTKITVNVFDKYDNRVDKDGSAAVELKSTAPTIGDVEAPATQTSDSTGTVYFNVKVTSGNKNDTFPIVAKLVLNDKTDDAKCFVGQPRDRFYIFYSDTNGYNAAAKIEGTCGDRYPVTITASLDGVTPITTRNDTFEIEFPGSKGVLNAYSDATSTAPITKGKLVSGKMVIWITSTGSAVTNGEITVYTESKEIIQATRQNIFFLAPEYVIKSAAYFADNGIGQVNRVEIYYQDTLKNATYLPDSLELYWPAKNAASKLIVIDSTVMTIDPANKKHVTVLLNPAFDTCLTTNSGSSQLGKAYWKNPETPNAASQNPEFIIADSVGPLLKSATILERLAANGDDTMMITFSETVSDNTIIGSTLQLIKEIAGVADTTNIAIASAGIISGDTVKIVVTNNGNKSPAYGDKLKILSSGTIVDENGNKAHKDNRPVTIKMKQIPPDIDSSFYYDNNGDGVVDYLRIIFNKEVIKESVQVGAKWAVNNISLKSVVNGSAGGINYLDNNSMIGVDIDDKFSTTQKDITNGALEVTVTNSEFAGDKAVSSAADKAGPVIVSAEYFPGDIGTDASKPDSLKIEFSEPVNSDFNADSYLFYTPSGTCVVMLKELIANKSTSEKEKWYIIESITRSDKYPVLLKGDSVNINPDRITDKNGNTQSVENNKKVVVKINAFKMNLKLQKGPNPFNPANGEKIHISLRPEKVISGVGFEISGVAIYDAMGNKVWSQDKIVFDKEMNIEWNGRNNKGRLVGAGTYRMVLKDKPRSTGDVGVELQGLETDFLIGVKRP